VSTGAPAIILGEVGGVSRFNELGIIIKSTAPFTEVPGAGPAVIFYKDITSLDLES
jgi:hypothetical protein